MRNIGDAGGRSAGSRQRVYAERVEYLAGVELCWHAYVAMPSLSHRRAC